MLLISGVGFVLLSRALAALLVPIWPEPTQANSGTEVLWLSPYLELRITCGNHSVPSYNARLSDETSLYSRSQQRLYQVLDGWQSLLGLSSDETGYEDDHSSEQDYLVNAIESSVRSIMKTKLVPWKFHSRRSVFEPDSDAERIYIDSLVVFQSSCPSSSGFDAGNFFNADESYSLRVSEHTISVESDSTIGTMHALQTLKQLFYVHSKNKEIYTPYAPIAIQDKPYWRYRGISLDIARNPYNIEDVLRTIDTMATVKLNRLHIHGTDSQSWPIEIPALPDLARNGAYQPHLVWTANDLARVQRHGVSRGVQVFLELDMPGHTASIAHSYPELIAAFNILDWSTFAAEPLSGQLKLRSERVEDFLDTLFNDLLPRMSRYSSIYHLGGDEVNRMVHLFDETVRSSEHATLQPLIQVIMQRIYSHAVRHGLRPMIWEEMILEWNLTFKAPTSDYTLPHSHSHLHHPPRSHATKPLVQAWRSSSTITTLLSTNHSVIFGDSQHWYLDCGFGEFFNPYPSGTSPPGVPYNTSGGIPTKMSPPYLDYCGPYHNWKAIYTFNPLANISEELWPGIEGGETLLWSELTDSVDLDFKLWPRAAAAAEVLWRGPRSQGQLIDATTRLAVWRERVVADLGVRSGNVQMTWCLMEGGCEL